MKNPKWGHSILIDLHECDPEIVKSKEKLQEFSTILCKELDLVPIGEPNIRRFGKDHLEGYSLIQFIETSSIAIHLDEVDNRAFIDIFGCKKIDKNKAEDISKSFFKAQKITSKGFFRE